MTVYFPTSLSYVNAICMGLWKVKTQELEVILL